MTTILVMCEEKLFADGVFSCLMSANLPDTLNLMYLPPSRRVSASLNLSAVDVIIYKPQGFDKPTVSFLGRLRSQNPNTLQINVVSDVETALSTDKNIEFVKSSDSFSVLETKIASYINKKGQSTVKINPTATTKRQNLANAVLENLNRLYLLDSLFENGDKAGYTALFRDVLEVAFNQTALDKQAMVVVRKFICAYLHSFFYRNTFDIIFSGDDFLAALNNPQITEKQITRLFMKVADLITTTQTKPTHSAPVVKAQVYIKKNLFKDLSLTAVAEALELNPSYLSRVFSSECGEPMSGYIAKLKISAAKGYLISGEMAVNEISQKLGFRSDNYFIRFFKKYTGLPPQAWREKNCVN